MVALQAGSSSASLKPTIEGSYVGNMLYLGGWTSGKADVTATSGLLQQMATPDATGGIGLLVAADQEGASSNNSKGDFTRHTIGPRTGHLGPAHLRSSAKGWGAELKAAGVNLNLSPVADVVPTEIGEGERPDRTVGPPVRVRSRRRRSIGDRVHPGHGRCGSADLGEALPRDRADPGQHRLRQRGVDDPVMTAATDAYLQPFVDGWTAGAGLVMMSSARYPQLDADNPAMFSPAIIDGLLRQQLGFRGVVITDDINAEAVRPCRWPIGRPTSSAPAATSCSRATPDGAADRCGDLLDGPVGSDLRGQVETSAKQVLTLKASMGLVPGCSRPDPAPPPKGNFCVTQKLPRRTAITARRATSASRRSWGSGADEGDGHRGVGGRVGRGPRTPEASSAPRARRPWRRCRCTGPASARAGSPVALLPGHRAQPPVGPTTSTDLQVVRTMLSRQASIALRVRTSVTASLKTRRRSAAGMPRRPPAPAVTTA